MKKGFTLAEVLITLGIIGVVAAITIPNLITKVQNNIYVNQFKKSYSVMQQGLKKLVNDDDFLGDFLSTATADDAFYEKLIPYFQSTFNVADAYGPTKFAQITHSGNISNVNTCKEYVGKEQGIAYKVDNRSQCVGDPSGMLIVLNNGEYFSFEKLPASYLNKGILAEIEFDTNGLNKPNMYGYDFFNLILLDNGEVTPAGSRKYAEQYAGDDWQSRYWATGSGYTCKDKVLRPSYSGYGSGCAAAVIDNNWTINYK